MSETQSVDVCLQYSICGTGAYNTDVCHLLHEIMTLMAPPDPVLATSNASRDCSNLKW